MVGNRLVGGAMKGRVKKNYAGIYYRKAPRLGGKGTERVYYTVFKKDGTVHEDKVGRQYVDNMTPARAARIRAERIEGRRLSRKEQREAQEAAEWAEANRWTIGRLWGEYKANRPNLKGIVTDENRFRNHVELRNLGTFCHSMLTA